MFLIGFLLVPLIDPLAKCRFGTFERVKSGDDWSVSDWSKKICLEDTFKRAIENLNLRWVVVNVQCELHNKTLKGTEGFLSFLSIFPLDTIRLPVHFCQFCSYAHRRFSGGDSHQTVYACIRAWNFHTEQHSCYNSYRRAYCGIRPSGLVS